MTKFVHCLAPVMVKHRSISNLILGAYIVLVPMARASADDMVGSSPAIEHVAIYRTKAVAAVSFSKDGRSVASTGFDKTIHVWEWIGSKRAQFSDGTPNGQSVSFSPNGAYLAATTGGFYGPKLPGITIWTLPDHKPSYWFPIAEIQEPACVAFSPNGSYVVSGAESPRGGWAIDSIHPRPSGSIEVWDIGDLKRFRFDGPRGSKRLERMLGLRIYRTRGALSKFRTDVVSVDFSPDSKILATGGLNKICLWSLPDGALIREINTGRARRVGQISYHPKGRLLLSVAGRHWSDRPNQGWIDRVVHIWKLEDGTLHARLKGHTGDVRAAEFSPNGKLVASASTDNTIRLWDVDTKKPVATIRGHKLPVVSVAFSPDGTKLASGSWDQTVRIWDIAGLLPSSDK